MIKKLRKKGINDLQLSFFCMASFQEINDMVNILSTLFVILLVGGSVVRDILIPFIFMSLNYNFVYPAMKQLGGISTVA